MTREEAITYFKRHIDLYCVTGICREAEEIAIKALEQEPTTKNNLGVDCISRQAVEDAMYDATRAMDLNYGQIMEYIDKLPSVTPQEPRWIPVSERLPEENICDDGYHEPSELILAYMKSGEMHVARYWSRYDYRWLGIITPTTDEVIAWMPLPKAYREVEE